MLNRGKFYSIGQMAKICRVPVKTLRYYDEIGLLIPKKRQEDSRYRYYEEEQMLTLFIIRKLQLLDFSLLEIKALLNSQDSEKLEQSVEHKLELLGEKINALQKDYAEGNFLLRRLQEGQSILRQRSEELSRLYAQEQKEPIRVEQIPERTVIYTRKIKKNYKNADISVDRWFEIFDMAKDYRISITGPVILIYHNAFLEQFLQNDCDLEICAPVETGKEFPCFKKYGGFRAVTALHIGDNSKIIQTHAQAIQWARERRLPITTPVSEEYILSPLDMNNQEQFITKVIIPLAEQG